MFLKKMFGCFFLLFLLILNNGCESKDKVSDISLTHELEKTVRLVFGVDGRQLIACDIKGLDDFSVNIIRNRQIQESLKTSEYFRWLGSHRDKLFFCSDDSICALTISGDVIFKHLMSDFNIDSSQYEFGSRIKTDGRFIWFSVEPVAENRNGVVLWDSEQSPTQSSIKFYDLLHETDPFGRIIVDFGSSGGLYIIDRKESIVSKEEELYSSGISVLSTNFDGSIFLVNEDLSKKTVIARRGQEAKWGYDNNVYFTKNNSELWRYDSQAKKTRKIFSTGLKQCKNEMIGREKLVLSEDRKWLAFSYVNPFPQKDVDFIDAYRCGLIILDIESGEFVNLSPEWFYQLYLNLVETGKIQISPKTHSYLTQGKHYYHLGKHEIHILD